MTDISGLKLNFKRKVDVQVAVSGRDPNNGETES